MLRSLLLLLVAAPLVAAAPPPKGAKKVELYHPTKVGTKWVSETTSGEKKSVTTREVTQVEEKDGVFRVTVEAKNDGGPAVVVACTVSSTGVEWVARGGKDLPQLKLPAKKSDTWDVDSAPAIRPAGQQRQTLTHTVGDEVPAGKYKAIPVQVKRAVDLGGGATRTYVEGTTWYAPGVGVVKAVSKVGDAKNTGVLESFTPGK